MQSVLEEALDEYLPIYAANDDIASVHRLLLVKCAPLHYMSKLKEKSLKLQKQLTRLAVRYYLKKSLDSLVNMTTVEEMEFIENIRRFAMDYFGAELPEFEKQNK